MPHNIDDLATFTTAYTDDIQQGDGLCRIHWLNGDPGLKTPGSFFVTRRRLEDYSIIVEGSPWRQVERTFRSGASEDGYEARALKLAVLGFRQSDVIINNDGVMTHVARPPRSAPKPPNWSLHVEVLVMAQGLDVPVVWASKRIKTSMAIITMLREYQNELLQPFRRSINNLNVPRWAFWLPVRGQVDARKVPVYEKTKGAPVTPPKLILPDGDMPTVARSLYVGREMLARGEALRAQYDAWLKETPAGSPGDAAAVLSPVDGADPYNDTF